MADELHRFRSDALCIQPTSCSFSCCNEPPRHRENRCNERVEEYPQTNANEPLHQPVDNFVPTLGARSRLPEQGGATEEQWDQRAHQAVLFLAAQFLRQKLSAPLLPQEHANLRC